MHRRAFLLSLATLAVAGCDALTMVKGSVKDFEGKGVADATVRLAPTTGGQPWEVKSRSDGSFRISQTHGLEPDQFSLSVGMEGYKTVTAEVKARRYYECTVVLAGESQRADSSIGCRNAARK
jgi:hypothetical protein